jgi:hypothetical protein
MGWSAVMGGRSWSAQCGVARGVLGVLNVCLRAALLCASQALLWQVAHLVAKQCTRGVGFA